MHNRNPFQKKSWKSEYISKLLALRSTLKKLAFENSNSKMEKPRSNLFSVGPSIKQNQNGIEENRRVDKV